MTSTSIDSLITGDLAALGEDNRRQLVAVDDALRTTNMYRDDLPGAEARRNALADERRRELVMMPLQLSHVFAHRVGRAAAGGAAVLCTLTLLAMMADPLLMRVAAWLVPGLNIGMILLLAGIGIISVYVVATWCAEAWFARRMRSAIKTGDDAYRDLDELARGPIEIAQHAVRRVDRWSFGLFFGGMLSLAVTFGYVGSIVAALLQYPYAGSISAVAEGGTLERNLGLLQLCVVGIALFATWLTLGLRTSTALLPRLMGHWSMLVSALVVGLGCAYVGLHTLDSLAYRNWLPTGELRYALGLGSTFAIVTTAAWVLLWWRRREQSRLGESDTLVM